MAFQFPETPFAASFCSFDVEFRIFGLVFQILNGFRHELSSRHIEIGQCGQGEHLRGVFGQPTVANPAVAELAFNDAEDVFHFGTDRAVSAISFPLRT